MKKSGGGFQPPCQIRQKVEIVEVAQFESLTPGEAFEMLHQDIKGLPEDCKFSQAGTHRMSRWARQLIGAHEATKAQIVRFLNEEEFDEDIFEKQDWFWRPYLIAAGVLKLEEAVPGILKSQLFDWDWINELAPQALAEMKQWRAQLAEKKKSDDQLKKGLLPNNSPLAQMMKRFENSSALPEPKPTPKLRVKPDIEIGRNDPCHCGSSKKYKKCCLA